MASDNTKETFTLSFADKLSGPAKKAADAIGALEKKIAQQTAAMKQLERQQAALGPRTADNAKKYDALGARISQARSRMDGAQQKLGQMRRAFDENHTGLRGLIARYQEAPGPLGNFARGAGDLLKALGSTPMLMGFVVGGALALVAGLAAAGAAAAAAAVQFTLFAVSQADARRAELLHLEGLATLRTAYQHQTTTGAALQQSIDRVADSSALARPEIARMAEQLHRAGLRGQALTQGLEAVSIAQSVQGDVGAARWRAQVIQAARLGQSVEEVANRVRSRLGPIATRQALTWDRQMQRLHESIAQLFDGIHIEGLLSGVHEVVSLVSQASATGRALRSIFGALLNPFLDSVGGGAPLLRRFFQGIVLGALHMTLIFLRVRDQLRETFGPKAFGGLDAGTVALRAGVVVALALGTAILGIARAVVLAAQAWVALKAQAASFATWIDAHLGAGAFDSLIAAAGMVGTQVMRALGRSILGGLPDVLSSISTVAGAMVDRITGALEIHSPSRVFARLGREIPRGLAAGVAGERAAEGSVGALADRLVAAPEGGGAIGGAGSTSIGPFYITVEGGASSGQIDELEERLADFFEGLAIRRGAAPA